jgi:TATA-box binding protein (TBP) (component of TFIID and TFIIIB)
MVGIRFKVVDLCKKDAMSVVPQDIIRYDLERCVEILRSKGFEVKGPGVMIRASRDGTEMTLYKNGRMMMTPAENKEKVRDLAQNFYALIETARERP